MKEQTYKLNEETKMKNIPQKIYLQIGDDMDLEREDFSSFSEVTWHRERVFDTDIEYNLVQPKEVEVNEDELWNEVVAFANGSSRAEGFKIYPWLLEKLKQSFTIQRKK